MLEIKKFYGFVETLFFVGGFAMFLLGMFLRNNFYATESKVLILSLDLPFILVAIIYGLLSLRYRMNNDKGEGESTHLVDGVLIFVGVAAFAAILFLQLAYPDVV